MFTEKMSSLYSLYYVLQYQSVLKLLSMKVVKIITKDDTLHIRSHEGAEPFHVPCEVQRIHSFSRPPPVRTC